MKKPEDMLRAVAGSLQERTGRTLEEWVAVVERSGVDPLDQKAVRRWLGSEHGVKQNSQWAIADAAARAAGWTAPTAEEYLDKQYAGAKAHLRLIYDKLAEAVQDLGEDVWIEPRGGYTPFIRKRQFAAVAAASLSHVDLGLRYVDPPPSARLDQANAPGQSTHKVRLESASDVDPEVLSLLAAAYDQNG